MSEILLDDELAAGEPDAAMTSANARRALENPILKELGLVDGPWEAVGR